MKTTIIELGLQNAVVRDVRLLLASKGFAQASVKLTNWDIAGYEGRSYTILGIPVRMDPVACEIAAELETSTLGGY